MGALGSRSNGGNIHARLHEVKETRRGGVILWCEVSCWLLLLSLFRFCSQVSGINTYFVSHYSAWKLYDGFVGRLLFHVCWLEPRVRCNMTPSEDFARIIQLVPVACLWLAFSLLIFSQLRTAENVCCVQVTAYHKLGVWRKFIILYFPSSGM